MDLCKTKETTAFLDGDRGGDLILKELMQVAPVDYVARAPLGKEVEDLTPKEIMKCLREKVPIEAGRPLAIRPPEPVHVHVTTPPRPPPIQLPENVISKAKELRGTLEGMLFDQGMGEIARLPVSELAGKLADYQGISTIVFDGVVTQRLLDLAEEHGVKLVIGDRVAELTRRPSSIKIMTLPEVAGPLAP
jgi:DNA primase